jgi:hypothetical protein
MIKYAYMLGMQEQAMRQLKSQQPVTQSVN